MVIGINKAFGIFFVEYVNAFETTSSAVSSVLAVQTVSFSISCKYMYRKHGYAPSRYTHSLKYNAANKNYSNTFFHIFI